MRLDKFLADMGLGSRKEVKGLIKKGTIEVNGQVVKSDKAQVNEFEDAVTYLGEIITYQKDFYYILHKPAGVISATQDNHDQTVIDLLEDQDYREDLFPVGRLDKDTEGLLILTNDGVFAHQLLSPKKHVEKEYLAEVSGIMTEEDIRLFAELQIDQVDQETETSIIRLILHEGKFHQVKRMVKAVGKEVLYLKRIRMGKFWLPKDLNKGQYRPMTKEELEQVREK